MSARIKFIESGLRLIHIPLPLYSTFLQPLLKLLFADEGRGGEGLHGERPSTWSERYSFLNISVTPIECSVVCSREQAEQLFGAMPKPAHEGADKFSISTEDYVVVQVDGENLDAGQRVLELTSPLALAGISIFFITTYFSDYILFPTKSRGHVVTALNLRGFVFEKHTDATEVLPSSASPSNLNPLQRSTFALLELQNVSPVVHPEIRLVQCAGRKESSPGGRSVNDDAKLHLGLVKCLVHQPLFLSLTLTDTEPASLLLEKQLLSQFGNDDVLLGSMEDVLIPITLDLRGLPLDSTGIVCGVAGRLVGSSAAAEPGPVSTQTVEMSYLSTAMAGTVMVGEQELARTTKALLVDHDAIFH